jgi:hypothetical protein
MNPQEMKELIAELQGKYDSKVKYCDFLEQKLYAIEPSSPMKLFLEYRRELYKQKIKDLIPDFNKTSLLN